jgi:hypothetical protein
VGRSVSNVRGSLLYGAIAVLVGVVGAALLGTFLGGVGSPASATGSLPATFAGSGSLPTTFAGSGSASPVESAIASLSAPQPTARPTPVTTPAPLPTRTPRPTPTPNTGPRIETFSVPNTEDCTTDTAGSIRLSWTIANATGATLSIDGPGIFDSYPGTSQTIDVPFGCSHQQLSHTYTLTTTGGSGAPAGITKTVIAKPAKVKSFTLGPADCPTDSGSVGISFAYEIVAATGVQLKRDGEVYATYSGKANDDIVVYDCTKASQTFRLTTTGEYGDAATMKLVVERSLA